MTYEEAHDAYGTKVVYHRGCPCIITELDYKSAGLRGTIAGHDGQLA